MMAVRRVRCMSSPFLKVCCGCLVPDVVTCVSGMREFLIDGFGECREGWSARWARCWLVFAERLLDLCKRLAVGYGLLYGGTAGLGVGEALRED